MIDIETLDTKPSAVVLSIAVVIFGTPDFCTEPGSANLAGRVAGDMQLLYPSLREQVDAGRTISADTVKFWCQQDEEAFLQAFVRHRLRHEQRIIEPGRWSIADCAEALTDFISTPMPIWANGLAFDLVILESLFGGNVPWKFYQGRDVRTIREVSGIARDWKPEGNFIAHDPIDDCRRQVAVVEEARRLLGRK